MRQLRHGSRLWARIQPLARELPYAVVQLKKEKKKEDERWMGELGRKTIQERVGYPHSGISRQDRKSGKAPEFPRCEQVSSAKTGVVRAQNFGNENRNAVLQFQEGRTNLHREDGV